MIKNSADRSEKIMRKIKAEKVGSAALTERPSLNFGQAKRLDPILQKDLQD